MNRLSLKVFRLPAVLVIAFVLPTCALAQIGNGNLVKLSGTVFSAGDNKAIAQAEVRLCDPGGTLIELSSTNDAGEFGFRGVERGRYVLTIDANGFGHEEMQVDLSFTSQKGVIVELKPLKKDQGDAAASGLVSAHEMGMPQNARDLVSAGRTKLYTQKNAQGSLQDFALALEKAPGYYEADYETGMAFVQLGRTDDAENSFRKSIEVSRDSYGDGEVALGTLLAEKGNASEGERALQRGIELNPNSWRGYFELGKLEFNQNRLDEARKAAEQARSIAPSVPMTYRLLANIHLKQQDYKAALEDIDAYVKLDPNSPAGIRAKEMRDELARKAAAQSVAPNPVSANPRQ